MSIRLEVPVYFFKLHNSKSDIQNQFTLRTIRHAARAAA